MRAYLSSRKPSRARRLDPGNHEFDYGWTEVQRFNKIAHFPIVNANIVNAQGQHLMRDPWIIKTVGGIRVAVIGVVLAISLGIL